MGAALHFVLGLLRRRRPAWTLIQQALRLFNQRRSRLDTGLYVILATGNVNARTAAKLDIESPVFTCRRRRRTLA